MRLLTVALIGAGVVLVGTLGWAIASGRLGGGSSKPELVSPLRSPSPSPQAPTGDASPTITATPQPTPSSEAALLYSQFGETEDTLWLAPLSRLDEPRAIAAVAHARFWGISASLSPDGHWVAYAVLPPTVPNPEQGADAEAEVWVLSVTSGEPQLLARGADVRLPPIWSPDSAALVFQRFDRQRNAPSLFRVNLPDKVVSSLDGATSVFPVAFGPGGDEFYAVRDAEGGTELLAINVADGSTQTVATFAGGVARDWRLSPDRRRMSFVGQMDGQQWGLWIVDLDDGSLLQPEAEGLPTERELFSPVWHPQQALITLGTAPGDDGNGVLNIPLSGEAADRLPGPDRGFQVPLSWSPQGGLLVVQEFAEYPVQLRSHLRLITADGQGQLLADEEEVTFVGWAAGGD